MIKNKLLAILFLIFLNMNGQQSINKNKIIENSIYLEFKTNNKIEFGSGFLVRDNTAVGDFVYLVTAKHVLGTNDSNGVFNLKDNILNISYFGKVTEEKMNTVSINVGQMLNDNLIRFLDDNDVAVLIIGKIVDGKINYVTAADFKEINVYEGNSWTTIDSKRLASIEETILGLDTYIFGYPKTLGIQKSPQFDYNKPLLRKGIVAGIYKVKRTIILDCPAYGGNSGGPVYSYDSEGNFQLVGVVSQYIPYISNNVLNNSSYSVAVSAEVIDEILNTFRPK
ncbi:trypsin-like peptidase [Maribacter spongiicola]|uniref:Trypsin-like peptidase n=1 Tax=Maribacter spongiicola TaxID=1206753 RepID=A0A4R7K418_9FLAO|nr:serine protease [Maribacter spongiicola]TDT45194.1 trypsin-like peptidase [Maribacter spongiicola]